MEYLPKQGTFMRNCDEITYSGYIGGFGSGKTHVLAIQAIRVSTIPSRGLIGAPTYRMLEDTTQWKFFDLCPPSWIRRFEKRRNAATLVNGTEILFRSLDQAGRLAGLDLDWFACDEIGEVKEDVFRMLQGRLKQSRIRKGFVVGNPAGMVHWTYDYFVKKAAKFPHVYRLVQAASGENTFLPPEFVEDLTISFGEDTAYYRQYVLGQFVCFEGAFWPNFNPLPYPAGHVMSASDVKEFVVTSSRAGRTPRWGRVIDFGFEHPFVCMWYVTDGEWIIFFDEYYQERGLIKYHCLQIKQHEQQHQLLYGPHNMGNTWTDHEAVSRAEIAACRDDEGKLIGFPCAPVEKKVMEGILLVQALFGQSKLYITESCRNALIEVPSYRCRTGVLGEEPLREKDDTCCCLRYACWAEMNHHQPYRRYSDAAYSLSEVDNLHEMEYGKLWH